MLRPRLSRFTRREKVFLSIMYPLSAGTVYALIPAIEQVMTDAEIGKKPFRVEPGVKAAMVVAAPITLFGLVSSTVYIAGSVLYDELLEMFPG